MVDRQFHANDNARESKANVWIFEGSSLYLLIGGMALAILLYRFGFDRLHWGNASIGLAAIPIFIATAYVILLKAGKPKSYDMDFFRTWGVRFLALLHRAGLVRSTIDIYAVGTSKRTGHPYSNL
jgi:hypothetical protein